MWAELQLDTRAKRHDECRDRLLEALWAKTTPIPVPAGGDCSVSSVLVQGPPGSDVATALRRAAHSLPHDLRDVVVHWKMDEEAEIELRRTTDQEWSDFWQRAREQNEARESHRGRL